MLFLSGDLPFLYFFPTRNHLFCTCTRILSLPSLRERKTHPHPNGFPLDRRNKECILFTTSWAHLSFPQKIRCGIFKYVHVISLHVFQCLSIFYTTLNKNCLGLKIQKNLNFLTSYYWPRTMKDLLEPIRWDLISFIPKSNLMQLCMEAQRQSNNTTKTFISLPPNKLSCNLGSGLHMMYIPLHRIVFRGHAAEKKKKETEASLNLLVRWKLMKLSLEDMAVIT